MAKTFLKPINIPSEVSLSCKDKSILAKGKLGELVLNVHSDVELLIDDEKISFSPSNELPQTLALTGTMRALTKNIIEGVSVGFERKLEINGVGYRAKLSGNKLELSLGFSHPVVYELPEAVSAEVPSQTEIVLKSAGYLHVYNVSNSHVISCSPSICIGMNVPAPSTITATALSNPDLKKAQEAWSLWWILLISITCGWS